MKLQVKFSLYNAITKIAIILVLGAIILFSLDRIAYNQLDNRLLKKKARIIEHLDTREIDSLLSNQESFTDYNILKEEFIILTDIDDKQIDTPADIITEKREIEGDIEFYRILNYNFQYHENWYKLELGESMTALEGIKNYIRFYMLIVLVISLLITLVTDFAFTNFLLKPFYLIIDKKINRVNDPTLYNYENIPTNTDDFKILDNSVNTLMKRINTLFLLEKQFIANVSHELLTPISVLSTRFENMLNTPDIPVEHENKIFASLKTLNRLKVIINSLLLISKVENNQYLKTEEINLEDELDDIYEVLEDRISDKKLVFNQNIITNLKFIGNKALVHTLLINVINNAVKFNIKGGSINIYGNYENENYRLKVSDSGIGMTKELLEDAFERFKRGNDEEQGFGLGLAIVQSIAKFHKIEIDIESEINSGTIITLIFPK
ncbi:HAMP domain-containing sensor histidine kinase [Pedobacter aquatilis]|uniref:sensor histidine kinase n=1 Tax=Pedobacter aquatilis TaxID=351343 RepID=UPI0025B36042|nr:HAMP domain-containing sensor histidine kinase [Pedobacter aquatilis]MDN3586816.1 HAMP domain-containing sensor histidine kinase [Pedobacter aquatilis]